MRPRLEKGTNRDYRISKISRNIETDREKDEKLMFLGWTVIHFWGKEILQDTDECIKVIEETIFDLKIQNQD